MEYKVEKILIMKKKSRNSSYVVLAWGLNGARFHWLLFWKIWDASRFILLSFLIFYQFNTHIVGLKMTFPHSILTQYSHIETYISF